MTKLIIAPTEFELSVLTAVLKCKKAGPILDFAVYRTGSKGSETIVLRCGPGMANAAAATALALNRFKPDHVFHVGVCGVYQGEPKQLTTVVTGTMAVFADTGVDLGDSFLSMQAIDLPLARLDAEHGMFNSIDLHDACVPSSFERGVFFTVAASSGSVDRGDLLRARFKIDGSQTVCEDMESAAVALVAFKAGVPCTVLRGISNMCGERNYEAWKLSEAAEAAQQALLKCL